MNALPAARAVPPRLKIAVSAADPATARRLTELIAQSGHVLVPAADYADAILTDGSVTAAPGVPILALGTADGDFAGWLPAGSKQLQVNAALLAIAAGLRVRPLPSLQLRFSPLPEEPSPRLTPREVEVLTALAEGLGNKAVARRLGISPHTVKFHIESLFRKLDAGTRAEAVAKGLRRQIVEF